MTTIRRVSFAAASLALCAFLILLAVGVLTGRAEPRLRRGEIALGDWPASTEPIRVALLSDIHLGRSSMHARRLDRIVARVNAARPDLVLLAGDFVNGHSLPSGPDRTVGLTAPLAKLRAPLGAVAVLGNHDYWTDPVAVRRSLEAAGVTVLENAAVRRGPIVVVGVGDVFSGRDRPDQALASAASLDGPRVVLTHSPDLATKLHGTSPILAGHTHCGQVVLPLVGSLAGRSPREGWRRLYDPRYRCGLLRTPRGTIVVTAGVGAGSLLVRLAAYPDWWVLTLGSARR